MRPEWGRAGATLRDRVPWCRRSVPGPARHAAGGALTCERVAWPAAERRGRTRLRRGGPAAYLKILILSVITVAVSGWAERMMPTGSDGVAVRTKR